MKKNLINEIKQVLLSNNKTEDNIQFVCDDKKYLTWDFFKSIAYNIEYDNGHGGVEINLSLKIVGNDFWLERHEYDGSEWWEFKTLPNKDDLEEGVFVIKDFSEILIMDDFNDEDNPNKESLDEYQNKFLQYKKENFGKNIPISDKKIEKPI